MADTASLLAAERGKATFVAEQLARLVSADPKRRARMVALVQSDPLLCDRSDEIFLTDRKKAFALMLQKWHRTIALSKRHGLSPAEARTLSQVAGVDNGIGLHTGVFVPTILKQSAPAQLDAWSDMLWPDGKWIGAYAQTELAHGSNVRGLETACTYVPQTDEFDVHSPHLSSIKWWPGALGVLCNHCVLYARLVVDGKDLGIHNFLVQLRDVDTHIPLPGVEVGDIGPKWATNNNDNGFLRLHHVRIPRFNMLSKFASLSRDGTYSRPGPARGAYGTMTIVRAAIVSGAYSSLSAALTIALRYTAVRQQEPGASRGKERAVLDYPSLQYRLLPYLAAAYALYFQGKSMITLNSEAQKLQEDGDFSMAASLHATSSALKSLCTTIASDGIEECRRACGGHGFSMSSGIPQLYAASMTSFTPEGDNWLLTQQAAKYLYRIVNGSEEKPSGVSAYLVQFESLLEERCAASSARELAGSLPMLLRAHQCRAAAEIATTLRNMATSVNLAPKTDGFMEHLVAHYAVSKAHALVSIVSAFCMTVEELEATNSSVAPVMRRLAALFAISWIERDVGSFIMSGHFSPDQAAYIKPAQALLLQSIRPDAIALVDSFGHTDYELNSAIGRSDGRYIDALYELAQKEPLNENQFKGFDQEHLRFMKDIIHGTVTDDIEQQHHAKL